METTNVSQISVLIVDDHPLIRESLAAVLGSETNLKIVGSCADAPSGLKAVETLKPDVVLMDISMPGPSPFDGVRQLKEQGCPTRFIFLSAYLTDAYVRDVIKSQASGYLVKTTALDALAKAVTAVHAGKTFFSPEVEERLARAGRRSPTGEIKTRGDALTPREIEVLRYLARGLSVKQMAETMTLSSRTVDRHKANIMHKLRIHNQTGLIRYAIAEGLADIDTFLEPVTRKTVA